MTNFPFLLFDTIIDCKIYENTFNKEPLPGFTPTNKNITPHLFSLYSTLKKSSPTQNIAPKANKKTKGTYANWTGSEERDHPSHHH